MQQVRRSRKVHLRTAQREILLITPLTSQSLNIHCLLKLTARVSQIFKFIPTPRISNIVSRGGKNIVTIWRTELNIDWYKSCGDMRGRNDRDI